MQPLRKEDLMSNGKKSATAPFNSLEEIAARKAVLKAQLKQQEEVLAQDLEAYRDDIDTLKLMWSQIVSLRKKGDEVSKIFTQGPFKAGGSSWLAGLSLGTSLAKIACTGILSKRSASSKKPLATTLFSLASNVISWLWQRREKRKQQKPKNE